MGFLGGLFNTLLSPVTDVLGSLGGALSGSSAGAGSYNQANQNISTAGTQYGNYANQAQQLSGYFNQLPSLIQQYQNISGIGGAANSNPMYQQGFTPNKMQQAFINQQQSGISNQMNMAMSHYRAQMGATGINDPEAIAAGEEFIRENYQAQGNQLQTNTEMQLNQQQANAVSGLMSLEGNLGQAGMTGMLQSGQAYSNLAALLSNQAQQQIQTQQVGLGALGSLLGMGFGMNAPVNGSGTK